MRMLFAFAVAGCFEAIACQLYVEHSYVQVFILMCVANLVVARTAVGEK